MDKLHGIEEYKVLLKQFRKEHKTSFSNLYFMPKDMERYINLGRVEYEKKEAGVIFYFDEECYYRVCMCVEIGETFNISKRDKKLLIRNIYRKSEQDEELKEFECNLERNGFNLVGTTFQVQQKTKELWQKCSRLEKYVLLMQDQGFRCIEADFSQYKEIESLILDSNIIKDYQLDYLTEQEKQMMLAGSYLCVLDKHNQICAVSLCVVNGGVARNGSIAVKEEYKMKGIAPLIAYQRFKWFRESGIDLSQTWIRVDNDASIKYNKSLGYQSTGKYANEWILEKANN